MKCPDAECRDKVTRAAFFIKIVGGAVVLLVTILLAWGLNQSIADDLKEAEVKKTVERVIAIEVQMEHIQQSIFTVKSDQREIRKSMDLLEKKQLTKQEIVDAVKEGVRND